MKNSRQYGQYFGGRLAITCWCWLALSFITSCSDAVPETPQDVQYAAGSFPFVIEPDGATLQPGQTVTLVAKNNSGAPLPPNEMTWNTNNKAIASVNSSGVVTAVGAGAAKITAYWRNRFHNSVTVQVQEGNPPPPPGDPVISRVAVTPTSASIVTGQSAQLSAQAFDQNDAAMNGVTFTWNSTNTHVATVSNTGAVSGVNAGGATITASAGDHSGAASITVTVPAPAIARVAVTPTSASINTGQSVQFAAQAFDQSGAPVNDVAFTWTSSNAQVVSISSSGNAQGVSAGNAVISAAAGDHSGSANVTVSAPAPVIASVVVTPSSATINAGQNVQLSAQARDASGAPIGGVTFTWASNNTAVATVSGTGNVSGVSAGNAVVSASAGGRSGSTSIAVNAPPPPPSSGEFLFASDWSTATGNGLAAVTDGGRWQMVSDNTTMEIVPSTGLDFPSANVYRSIATAARTGWSMVRKTGMPIPAIGESRYYRWYFRLLTPDGNGNFANHPIQDGFSASSSNWMFETVNGGNDGIPNGRWRPEFWLQAPAWPNARWRGPVLNKGQTYRFEYQIHRTGTNTFQMHIRVYDSAGNLLADDDDYRNDNGTVSLASNPTFTFVNVNWMDGLNAGCNGIHGTQPWPFTYAFEGAFAVCRNGWCGPYVRGEGR